MVNCVLKSFVIVVLFDRTKCLSKGLNVTHNAQFVKEMLACSQFIMYNFVQGVALRNVSVSLSCFSLSTFLDRL